MVCTCITPQRFLAGGISLCLAIGRVHCREIKRSLTCTGSFNDPTSWLIAALTTDSLAVIVTLDDLGTEQLIFGPILNFLVHKQMLG